MNIPIHDGLQVLQQEGLASFTAKSSMYMGLPIWNTVTSRYPIGTNIFDRDWDLLIILDTCRVDALETFIDLMPWLDDINQIRSVGSMSAEWMLNTFTEEYRDSISETAFVSGNIWSHRIFNEQFHRHDEHDYNEIKRGWPRWDPVTSDAFTHYEIVSSIANQNDRLHPENEAIPHILTDRTIAVGREVDFNRLIVHYTLPHLNFIADALKWSPGECSKDELMAGPSAARDLRPEEKSYGPARRSEVSRETVWRAYHKNLHLVLEYVDILLQNIDAEKVVISADHGEGFGEFGFWGHPFGCPAPPVKTVPWAKTTATDEGTYNPKHDKLKRSPTEEERRDFLEQMGYL